MAIGCSNSPELIISGYEKRIDVMKQALDDSGALRENPKLARHTIRLTWRLYRRRTDNSAEVSMNRNQTLRSRRSFSLVIGMKVSSKQLFQSSCWVEANDF